MPSVTARDRLDRAPVLDPAAVVLSPQQAADRLGVTAAPGRIRLSSFDGRPAYRIAASGRGDGERIVFADTGEEPGPASSLQRGRAAAAWTGQPSAAAVVTRMTEPDQWTVGNQLRTLRPLWKYSWPNGEDVYIGESGEVLLHTTRWARFTAYMSAVPHWLYFTPLRRHQPVWIRFATYAAMVGTAGAIVGVVLGAWLYSPAKKYRFAGAPSRVPYRGAKRWHTILGLIFGIATITWTFSGSLAFLPFPTAQPAPAAGAAAERPAAAPQGRRVERGGSPSLAAALRGRVQMGDFAAVHPRDLLSARADLRIKELAFTSFAGRPLFSATLADGSSRTLSLDGETIEELDRSAIVDIVKSVAPNPAAMETRTLDRYDMYYLDRTGERPLPVILAQMHDEAETRYYIDPRTATVVTTYSNRNWARRWFYNGLHSLNFPWLYNHRPLWDIVVITFMVGGTALSATSLVLAWRAVGKKLRQVAREASRRTLTSNGARELAG